MKLNESKALVAMVASMYVGEPCRVCGINTTVDDIPTLIYTGYYDMPSGRTSRSSHGACWSSLTEEERQAIIAKAEADRQRLEQP